MDLTSTLKEGVYRSIATILLPGAVAIAPYLFLAVHYFPGLSTAIEQGAAWSAVLLTLIFIGVGLLTDTLGAFIEEKVLDQLHDDPKRVREEWYRYLRIAFSQEPIGQRYLRSMTLHLKFELGLGVAIVLGLAGLVWLNCVKSLVSAVPAVGLAVLLLALAAYLFWEARASSEVLARVRQELLKGVSDPPIN